MECVSTSFMRLEMHNYSRRDMKAIKHGKLFRVYALLDKNKNGTKNFFIGHMCGSKVAESVYQTLPRTQHNSIPNILDNNLRRND